MTMTVGQFRNLKEMNGHVILSRQYNYRPIVAFTIFYIILYGFRPIVLLQMWFFVIFKKYVQKRSIYIFGLQLLCFFT